MEWRTPEMTLSNLNTNKLQPSYVTPNADFNNAATGTYSSSGINYKYVTFTASGTLTIGISGTLDVLIVGGGGGGCGGTSTTSGGPGGAGGFISYTTYLGAGSYSVTVGAGGAFGGPTSNSSSGSSSSLQILGNVAGFYTPMIAIGGGFGTTFGGGAAGSGGSGGGYANGSAGAGTAGQGYAGGSYVGGGSSGLGNEGTLTGGPGTASSITGTSVTYAAGGSRKASPVAGGANTGTGGDSAYNAASNLNGAAGGSGIVVVRVRTN